MKTKENEVKQREKEKKEKHKKKDKKEKHTKKDKKEKHSGNEEKTAVRKEITKQKKKDDGFDYELKHQNDIEEQGAKQIEENINLVAENPKAFIDMIRVLSC